MARLYHASCSWLLKVGLLALLGVYGDAALLQPSPCEHMETVRVPVSGDASDAFQYKKIGVTYSGSSGEIYVGRSAYHGDVVSALRFLEVEVPRDSHIVSASVRLVDAHAGTVCCKGSDLAVLLRMEKAVDSTPLPQHHTPGWLLSSLAVTAATVWIPPATDTFNVTETPDLSAMVQSIVSLPGWASGNAMTLILDGEGEANDVDERVYYGSAVTFEQHRAILSIQFCRPRPPPAVQAEVAPVCPPAPPPCEQCLPMSTMQASSASGSVAMADAAPRSITIALAIVAVATAAIVVVMVSTAVHRRGRVEDESSRRLTCHVDQQCGDSGI